MKKIEPNSKWRHVSGKFYNVVLVANEDSEGSQKLMYPPTVVYQGIDDKPLAKTSRRFLETMTLIE